MSEFWGSNGVSVSAYQAEIKRLEAEIVRLTSALAIANAQVASGILLRRAAEQALQILQLVFEKSQLTLPDYVAGRVAENIENLKLNLQHPPSADKIARVIEAAQEFVTSGVDGRPPFSTRPMQKLLAALAALKAKETPDGQ